MLSFSVRTHHILLFVQLYHHLRRTNIIQDSILVSDSQVLASPFASENTVQRSLKAEGTDLTMSVKYESGYSGDEESWDSSNSADEEHPRRESKVGGGLAKRRFKRRKRRHICSARAPTLPTEKTIPLPVYFTYRWLQDYFHIQGGENEEAKATLRDSHQDAPIFRRMEASSFSQRQIHMEEAIAISPFPRLVIESEFPYRIVHTNAAYARKYGQMEAPGVTAQTITQQDSEAQNAITALFDKDDVASLYPVVCSSETSESLSFITHFLIEGQGPRIEHLGRWNNVPSQAVG